MDPVGAALGVIPLVGDAYTYWRNHNVVANLFRELNHDLRQDARISADTREQVCQEVENLRVDPTFLGGIRAYMEEVDLDAVPALRARMTKLLELPDDAGRSAVADIVIESVQRNVNRAFRSDRDAAYHESRRSTKQVSGTIEGAEQRLASRIAASEARRSEEHQSLASAVERVERALTDTGDADGSTPSGPASGPERVLDDLVQMRPGDGEDVRRLWESQSAEAVAALIREPDSWLLGAHAEVWEALARLLAQSGEHSAALLAYEAALERGVRDRPRTLVRAAAVAMVSGQPERSAELAGLANTEGPDHPAVRLNAVDHMLEEPAEVLRLLADFESDDAADLATAEVLRARSALMLEEYDSARTRAESALRIDTANPVAARIHGLALYLPEQQQFAKGGRPDVGAVKEALADFEGARRDMRAQRRFDDSCQISALIVEAHLTIDDRTAALAALQAPELLPEEARSESAADLGRLAILLGRPELALSFLPETVASEEAKLFRASALARGVDRDRAPDGVTHLRSLMSAASDDAKRHFAAMALLIAASDFADVTWDVKAHEIVRADDPVAAAVLYADHLRLCDLLDDAEAELLIHSDHPGALNSLVRVSLDRGEFDVALERVDTLIRLAANGENRLLRAQVLVESGETDAAVADLLSIGGDPTLTIPLRVTAFRRGCDLAQRRRDVATLATVADSWRQSVPGSDEARWTLALALARLARHADALELLNGDLQIVTLDQAVLAAEIQYRAAPADAAIREIARYSDQFDRTDERLEFLVLLTALKHDAELPGELEQRVRDGFRSFPEKFPNSKLMWVVTAPTTSEELKAFVEEFVRPGSRVAADVAAQVRSGEAPVATLAAAVGTGVVRAWARSTALPLGSVTKPLTNSSVPMRGPRSARGRSGTRPPWPS